MSRVPNVFTVFGRGAGPITPETVRKLAGRRKDLEKKVGKTPEWFRCLEEKINTLFSIILGWSEGTCQDLSFGAVVLAAFALAYFLNPWDLVPDFLPLAGYMDDAAVILWAWESLKPVIKKYAGWKNLDLSHYW